MVPITDVMFLATKPRKIFLVFLSLSFNQIALFIIQYIYVCVYVSIKNLFLARPKPSTSSAIKPRLNNDISASSRSRPATGILARNIPIPVSAGK